MSSRPSTAPSLYTDASTNPYTWRRALLVEPSCDALPKRKAKTIPLREAPTNSETRGVNLTITVDGAIESQIRSTGGGSLAGTRVQASREQYRPANPERAMALRALKSVHAPLTTVRAAMALGWDPQKAKRWLHTFEAKGLLVKVSRCEYRWTGGGE